MIYINKLANKSRKAKKAARDSVPLTCQALGVALPARPDPWGVEHGLARVKVRKVGLVDEINYCHVRRLRLCHQRILCSKNTEPGS